MSKNDMFGFPVGHTGVTWRQKCSAGWEVEKASSSQGKVDGRAKQQPPGYDPLLVDAFGVGVTLQSACKELLYGSSVGPMQPTSTVGSDCAGASSPVSHSTTGLPPHCAQEVTAESRTGVAPDLAVLYQVVSGLIDPNPATRLSVSRARIAVCVCVCVCVCEILLRCPLNPASHT